MPNTILRAENLRKLFDNRMILNIPHLELEEGGIYALIGPNGAGKTTLLRILNLLETPTEGRIYFDGEEIWGSSPKALDARRRMTLVMQNPTLFRTSVYKNVAYGLKIRAYNKNAINSAVSEALKMVNLTGFEHRKARELSAGETQRVALARALILNPRLLFLDEPTANVDKRNIREFESLIREINTQRGTTVFMTTHNISQAHRLTDRIISLMEGRLMNGGTENIFYGSIRRIDESSGIVKIPPSTEIRAISLKSGDTGIYIDPKNITVSLDPDVSDRWNSLEGRVTAVALGNSHNRITLNAGIELVAIIGKDDFQKINPDIFNRRVYAKFKAIDVHTF
jgi:tungstate transport system ATP-binding protein